MVEKANLLSVLEQIRCCVQDFRKQNTSFDWLRPRAIVFITRKGSEQKFHWLPEC